MEKGFLTEAFKELSILNEEDYDLSDEEDVEKASNDLFGDVDEKEEIDVIDSEAKSEEDVDGNYVGKVIIDCNVCHSKIYKDSEEIHLDEETGCVNSDEECPYCYSTDGYTIVGMVAPYKEEEKDDDKDEDSEDDKDEKEDELKEDFNKVEIETDDEIMTMSTDADGGVTVNTKPTSGMVAPVSDELQNEINSTEEVEEDSAEDENSEESEDENSEESEDNEIDLDVDEVSEGEFDKLGESYFRSVYGNVKSYKTTESKVLGKNKMVVEGLLSFNSGRKKKTSFIFEARDADKRGNARFFGENLNLSNGKRAYVLSGRIKNRKFISESLTYSYKEGKKTIRGRETVK